MATYKRPGTYVEEVVLPQQIESQGTAPAVGAFLGTSTRGPTTATLVSSWTEFTRQFGTFDASHNLHFAMYQFFSNGGRSAYVARIAASDALAASVTLKDTNATAADTLKVSAINPGTWANSSTTTTGLNVESLSNGTTDRFDLLVYQGGSTGPYIVERFNDLSMSVNDARYVERVINGVSQYVVVANQNSATAAPANRPAFTGVKTLSAGTEGTAIAQADYTAALTFGGASAKFDTVPQSLVLNIPDVARLSDAIGQEIIRVASLYAESRGDVFVVADVSSSTSTVTAAQTWAGTIVNTASSTIASTTATGTNTAFYYPYITIPDPLGSAGMTRNVAPGASMVGLYLQTDATQGVQKAPAGIGNTIDNAVAPVTRLTATDLDNLNSGSYPINAIRSVPGAGVVPMGARTLNTTYSNRYINVRRTLIYLKKSLSDGTAYAIFENNDERLWQRLRTSCAVLLNNFWQQGGLRGATFDDAFFVKCDETINTAQVIANGEVRIEVGVALLTPAEFVVIRIGQFQGGTSVTSA